MPPPPSTSNSNSNNDDGSTSKKNNKLMPSFRFRGNALMGEIHMLSCGNNHNDFTNAWEAEVERVESYIQSQQRKLEASSKTLLQHMERALNSSHGHDHDWTRFQQQADDHVQWGLDLQTFISTHKQELLQIALEADRAFGIIHTARDLEQRFRDGPAELPWNPWNPHTAPQSTLVVALSDMYQLLRHAKTRNKENKEWVAPESFERRTTKFWVHSDHLTDLLVHACQEAPLLVYGKTGILTTNYNDDELGTCSSTSNDRLWNDLATPISSIYLDSSSHALYAERLKRCEGAQLLRVRWYGPVRPTDSQPLFLELKTHHEKWINSKSLKERATIRAQDMKAFLDFTTTTSKQWTMDDAQSMILKANPNLENDTPALCKAADRLLRMRQLVVRHKLTPCVRTVYHRVAFQSSQSSALRVTVDRHVTVIDETQIQHYNNNNNNSTNDWCLSDQQVQQQMTITTAQNKKVVPFVVLEVKLAGQDTQTFPPVIQDLQDRGVIVEAAKFSKFLTGASVFHARSVPMLPYWANHPAFCDMFGLTQDGHFIKQDKKSHRNSFTETTTMENDLEENVVEAMKFHNNDAQQHQGRTLGFRRLFQRRNKRKSTSDSSVTAPLIAPKCPARVEPKSYFANERTFIQWISAGLLLVTISVILLGIDSNTVEDSTTSTYARKAGIGVCGGAILIVFYSTFVYFRRLYLLSSGSAYGYVDHVGPFVLASSVCIGVVVLLTHFAGEIEFRQSEAAKQVFLHQEPGQCYLHSNRGISKLEYQPSDIAIDTLRDILLVPTLQRIVAHSLVAPRPNHENRAQTLVEIPNSNLEAVTIVDDRVFALSEGPTKTELIEMNWNRNEELEVSNRWKLGPSQQAEGMAYVPDKNRRSGRLFIDVNRQIQIYDLPDPQSSSGVSDDDDETDNFSLVVNTFEEISTELDRIGSINRHVLNKGLLVDTKISAMYYFEGVAYILHDNEMMIRAWDLDAGELLSEIPLPRVAGEFSSSSEWEGLALERRRVISSSSKDNNGLLMMERNPALRGTDHSNNNSATELILHLALDTPAQLWSMVIKEGSVRGDLILPSCAVNNAQNRNLDNN